MGMQETAPTRCEACGHPLAPGQLVCPNCGALVHRRRLEQVVAEAQRLEAVSPPLAALPWRQALDLLPPDSPQYAQIRGRLGSIASGMPPGQPGQVPPRATGGTDGHPTLDYEPR